MNSAIHLPSILVHCVSQFSSPPKKKLPTGMKGNTFIKQMECNSPYNSSCKTALKLNGRHKNHHYIFLIFNSKASCKPSKNLRLGTTSIHIYKTAKNMFTSLSGQAPISYKQHSIGKNQKTKGVLLGETTPQKLLILLLYALVSFLILSYIKKTLAL